MREGEKNCVLCFEEGGGWTPDEWPDVVSESEILSIALGFG